MQQNNMNGAFFLDFGGGYGLGYTGNGYSAFFSGSYGTGDFWRQNPDGTVSAKLSTNEATGDYKIFLDPVPPPPAPPFDDYNGTGHLTVKFTGTFQEICFSIPFPPYEICFTYLAEDPNINAFIFQGHATVTLNGTGEDPHILNMRLVVNPGGQSHFEVTFN